MKTTIFANLALGCLSLLAVACNDSVSDLLEPKVYFENKEYTIEVPDEAQEMQFDLAARLSTMNASPVEVSYSIADQSVVDAYNARFGTNFQMFDVNNVKLSSAASSIAAGKIYANNVKLNISNLNVLKEGQPFLLPIKVHSSSLPTLEDTRIAYYFITKPLKVKKVGNFNEGYYEGYIDLRKDPKNNSGFPDGTFFDSFTYEALIYIDWFGGNMTVMGTEGEMILRVGDQPGGITPRNQLEVAGKIAYVVTEPLAKGRWYHLAFTYDKGAGKSYIYINGELKASADSSYGGLDPNKDVGFVIGKINGFPWGERPFMGKMSEIRVWSVARTQNQIKQNMLSVEPTTEGLELYYKLNGSEEVKDGFIMDATGKFKGKTRYITIEELDTPVEIK